MEMCLKLRDLDPTLAGDLPEMGLIAIEENEVVAFGFLRKVEGPYAMLDSYLTNPTIAPEVRDKALDRITRKLISIAKVNHINKLIAFSADAHTIERAATLGFVAHSHVFNVLDLKRNA